TLCLYSSSVSLFNVRLTKADEAAVRVLKRAHVEISAIVRDALHREAERHRPRSAASTAELMSDIFEAYPEPERVARRRRDVGDRRQLARHVREQLRRRRQRK